MTVFVNRFTSQMYDYAQEIRILDDKLVFLSGQEARGGGGERGGGQLLPAPLRLAGGGGGRSPLHRTLPRD
jgi:hypothetical protein